MVPTVSHARNRSSYGSVAKVGQGLGFDSKKMKRKNASRQISNFS